MTNYLWTANLGVVPLLRLAAFLLLPLVLALRSLMMFVRLVHDAILNSLKIKTLTYVSVSSFIVKAILLIIVLNSNSYGENQSNSPKETLILAKGEQLELSFPKISQYSIGNKEVLSSKIRQKNSIIYIKGKSMGFTDLIVWSEKQKFHYQVFVISKKNHLEHAKILEVFKRPEWKVSLEGNAIALKGEINSHNQWFVLQELAQKNTKLILQDVSIDRFLKRDLLTSSYRKLSQLGINQFRCDILELPHIDCFGQQLLSANDIKKINAESPLIRWKKTQELAPSRNVRSKLKILSFDLEQGENWQKGLGYLQGQLHQVFEGAFWSMVKLNSVQFRKYWNQVHIVAEPEFILSPNSLANFTIGSEIPFWSKNSQQETQQLEWKFAGLKVQIQISDTNDANKVKVKYQTALTSPIGEQIQGHQQEAELLVDKNQNTILFDISYQSQNSAEQGIPFWKKIPILYKLFADDLGHKNQKKITAIINLSEEE